MAFRKRGLVSPLNKRVTTRNRELPTSVAHGQLSRARLAFRDVGWSARGTITPSPSNLLVIQSMVGNRVARQFAIDAGSVASCQPVVQREIRMTGSGDGDKTSMSNAKLRREVARLIASYRAGKVLEAIGQLQTSIATRQQTKARYDAIGYSETDNAINHEYRISLEQELLKSLEDARAADLASRAKKSKPQPDAGGWTTV